MTATTLSPDANLARLALEALGAATTEAVGVSSGLSTERALAALEELLSAGRVGHGDDGTWFVPPGRRRDA